MMSSAKDDIAALTITVKTTISLINQLLAATKPDAADKSIDSKITENSKDSQINALDLAHDAAGLIKAHSTKLSLLIINEPFTPSAINTVLRELASGPLPALATAVELCNAASYTKLMRSELQWRTSNVYTELSVLVAEVPLDGKILTRDQKLGVGATGGKGKGSLASTGVVWQSCDAVTELKKLGIAGLLIHKVEQYRDTLKDALEELREWGDETSDDEDENTFSDDGEEDPAQAAADAIFSGQRHIPSDDTHQVRERLESSLRRLKLVTLLYTATVKRRLKILPSLPRRSLPPELADAPENDVGIVRRLDEAMAVLGKIPHVVDELASAFYELDDAAIDKMMDECFTTATSAAELLVLDWEGRKDEFTAWASKFQMAMKRVDPNP